MANSNSDPEPLGEAARFLQELLQSTKRAAEPAGGKRKGLLDLMAQAGAGLEQHARKATEEFRQHVVEVRRKAPPLHVKARPASDMAWPDCLRA